ncbi:e3 ubiquitin-protein ligase UBR4 [Caerostris extrusa]|uniref:E3 ubiquitin-protein ligase UBR4 n=1 Tax=Caerostris extrusa TaxID=172846 RepID=A0AAV4MN23_CAEEX|nr:e3 ubiquitin-protein ligase UBR4 [Caerostris extrusa]
MASSGCSKVSSFTSAIADYLPPFTWCPENNSSKEMIRVMLPLLLDATTESLGDYTTLALERLIGSPEGDDYLSFNYFEVLTQKL